MRSISRIVVLAAMLVWATPGRVAEQDALAASTVPRDTPAQILDMPGVTYPNRGDREALVYVQFTIDAEGRTQDIQTLEDRGFYGPDFAREAVRTVRKTRFSPATRDGVPVASGPLVMPFRFSVYKQDEQGIASPFKKELNEVINLSKAGDIAGAHFHAESMLRDKVKTLYEFAILQAQLAETHAAAGDIDDAVRAAARATSSVSTARLQSCPPGATTSPNRPSNYLLPVDLVVSLLEMQARLHTQRGDLIEALTAICERSGLVDAAPDDPMTVLAERLLTILDGRESLGMQVRIGFEPWGHTLIRQKFQIREPKGTIKQVFLACGQVVAKLPLGVDKVFSVPKGTANCRIVIDGERGTTFQFVELADSDEEGALPKTP